MSLTTSSFFKKKSVPLDTFTGTRTTSANTIAGAKIFKLTKTNKKEEFISRKHFWVFSTVTFPGKKDYLKVTFSGNKHETVTQQTKLLLLYALSLCNTEQTNLTLSCKIVFFFC